MKNKGFSLVELLVVISIIALLVTILLPALQGARNSAKAVVCGANVKQLLTGLIGYTLEKDSFPFAIDDSRATRMAQAPPGDYVGYSAYDRMGWWWFHYMREYTDRNFRGDSIIRCPARNIDDLGINENPLWGNYGVNQAICKSAQDIGLYRDFAGNPLKIAQIFSPSATLLLSDCGYSVINWFHVTDAPPVTLATDSRQDMAYIPGLWLNESKFLLDGQTTDARKGRHTNKTINAGFVDGHVDRMDADDLYVEPVGNSDYKNLTPLWLPK